MGGFTGIVVGDYGGVGRVGYAHHTAADHVSAAAACLAARLGSLLGERLRRPFTDETPADTVRGCSAAVVVVTLQEGEGFDRSRLELSRGELRNPHADYAHAIILGHKDRLPGLELGDQERLIRSVAATGIPTVVVLQTGSPVLMPWLDQVAAVLQAWYPGEQGGCAPLGSRLCVY